MVVCMSHMSVCACVTVRCRSHRVSQCACVTRARRGGKTAMGVSLHRQPCFEAGSLVTHTPCIQINWPLSSGILRSLLPKSCRRAGVTDRSYHVVLKCRFWGFDLKPSCLCGKHLNTEPSVTTAFIDLKHSVTPNPPLPFPHAL